MVMSKVVELRQNRSLIRTNFDGYKLSLEPVAVLRVELSVAPHKAQPNDDQYSFLHAELFSLQNLLQSDPWARTTSYFVNKQGHVIRSCYNDVTGRAEALQVVYRMGSTETEPRASGDYNFSLRFVSEKYCILCDGIRTLVLLDTGDRARATDWKRVEQVRITTEDNGSTRGFLIYDARLDTIQEQKEISVALGRVHRTDSDSGYHTLCVYWAKWLLRENAWEFSILETLEGKGSVYYCCFEPRAESLVVSSNEDFRFRSQPPVVVQKEVKCPQQQLHNHGDKDLSWEQNDEDVIVKLPIREGKDRSDYNIHCTADKLSIKCGVDKILDCTLYAKVDHDLTVWTVEEDCLQITLTKDQSSMPWPSLCSDGDWKENFIQNGIPPEQQPIPNLEAPVEDCDFPVDTMDKDIKIGRFHLLSKTVTHTALLGSTPPLFVTCLRPGFPPAIATRQDVDASLWLQQYNPSRPEEWSLYHEGNLDAFGYVQASKTQRKFIDCAPDLSYALICESHRHIFLYKSNYDTANGLRNRIGAQVVIGKQHLITLEDTGEILGLATANSVVTLLTEKFILYLQVT